MSKTLSTSAGLLFLLFAQMGFTQPEKGQFISANIGFAVNIPYEEYDETEGIGFYLHGEYAYNLTNWFGIRPYAGLIFVNSENEERFPGEPEYFVRSNGFNFGLKARIYAPIPWIAPFLESGVGASIGTFETFTPNTNLSANGISLHIPFTIGLAIGRDHGTELAFSYYFNGEARQIFGGFGFGLTFPLSK
ncbi:MAG: hypothetical protein AAF688_06550 [Bacteroidota bacterium]